MTTPMALRPPAQTVTVLDRYLARWCLCLATALLRMPFPRLLATVTWLQQRTTREATTEHAMEFTAAVAVAGRPVRGRVACLEGSLAVTLLAVLRCRRVDWCIGARLLPYASHAWVEVGGQAVGEPATDRPYLLLLRV